MTDHEFRKRSRVILRNMASERPGLFVAILGRRWRIHHEALRADARRLLAEEARTDPDAELRALEMDAEFKSIVERRRRELGMQGYGDGKRVGRQPQPHS